MDQDRLKKLIQSALDTSYDESLLITEFRALPTHSYDNEKGEWVPDSHSLFLVVKKTKDCENLDLNVWSIFPRTSNRLVFLFGWYIYHKNIF
jgi:hypothetical protein